MKSLSLGLLALALLLPAAPAAAQTEEIQEALQRVKKEPPPRKPVALPHGDSRDYVFLAGDRPVRLRLHVQLDGRPYFVAADAFLRKWFAHFDRDGNGVLSKAELERAPSTQFLTAHLGGALSRRPQGQSLRFAAVDANKDGKVTLEEFAGHYRRTGFGALDFTYNLNDASANRSTDVLFKYLDANGDGKLSPQELSKAATVLQPLDRDEDEVLTAEELPASANTYNQTRTLMNTPGRPPAGLLVEVTEKVEPAAAALLAHYDRDKNKKLSRAEVGLDRAVFDRLDANHDGQLDAKELAGFFRRDADLEMIVRLGKLRAQESLAGLLLRTAGDTFNLKALQLPRLEVFAPKQRLLPLARALRSVDGEAAWLPLAAARLELLANNQNRFRFNGNRSFFLQQFEMLFDKKGYVERKQLQGLQYLEALFTLADRNADDRLTRAELTTYLKLLDQGAASFVTLTVTDHGCSLFEVLDTNADGRLSVRELRDAWKVLRPLAKSPDALARADIPRRVQLMLAPGRIFAGRRVAGVLTRSSKPTPLWFLKMDRNGDGDLSPTEFLGTAEDFRRLDTDGDGLISGAEARRAGKR